MKPPQSRIKRADYGIDAPTVVRNFFLIGVGRRVSVEVHKGFLGSPWYGKVALE